MLWLISLTLLSIVYGETNLLRRLLSITSRWYGNSGGGSYEDMRAEDSNAYITGMCIRSGEDIDSIQVWYSNGETFGPNGGDGGSLNCFDIPNDGCITRVVGSEGNVIDVLTFIDNTGKTLYSGGDAGGTPFDAYAPNINTCLRGISVRCGRRLDAIQFHWDELPEAPPQDEYEFTFTGYWAVFTSCVGCPSYSYSISMGATEIQSESVQNVDETYKSSTQSETWDTSFTVGAEAWAMSSEASVGWSSTNEITQSEATTIARQMSTTAQQEVIEIKEYECDKGYLYQYVTKVYQNNLATQEDLSYNINSIYHVCSDSAQLPKCPPGHCDENVDITCQICV